MTWLPANQPGDAAVPVPPKIGRYRPRIESPEATLWKSVARQEAEKVRAEVQADIDRADVDKFITEHRYPQRAAERSRLEAARAAARDRALEWVVSYPGAEVPPNLRASLVAAEEALTLFDAAAQERVRRSRDIQYHADRARDTTQRSLVARLSDEVYGGVSPEVWRRRFERDRAEAERRHQRDAALDRLDQFARWTERGWRGWSITSDGSTRTTRRAEPRGLRPDQRRLGLGRPNFVTARPAQRGRLPVTGGMLW